jgi:tetratricopeptide (TPR) repeat protein
MMIKRIPLAFALLLALSALIVTAQTAAPATPQGKTVAVVIGVSRYAKLGGGQQLQFADRDAALMAEALKKAGVSADNLRLLTAQEATVAAIKSVLGNWLARTAGADDTAIIFFSGHGLFEQEFGEAYLLGADSDAKDPFSTALSFNEINQALAKRVHARRVLLITDAMRRDFFDPDTNSGAATAFLQGFDQLAAARGGLSVIAASGPGEFSREGQRWNGQGVFSKHLAAALASGQFVDRNHDGTLTADELFDVLAPLVAEDTSNKQHVWHSNTPLAQIAISAISRNATTVTAKEAAAVKPQPQTTTLASAASPSDTRVAAAVQPASSNATPASTPAKVEEVTRQNSKDVAPVVREAEPSTNVTSAPPTPTIARAEPPTARAAVTPAAPRRLPINSPPAVVAPVETAGQPSISSTTNPGTAANVPPPPRPMTSLPKIGEVAAPNNRVESVGRPAPAFTEPLEAAPSPLILQLEAAIATKRLLEPKTASAWEMYQKLAADPSTAADAARLRPALADALIAAGRAIVAGEVCSDSIADRVEDFRRAGQMLARARTLKPESAEINALEKLSAAQALIALQFYDEAERALAPLQTSKLAAVENAMGLVHQGKLDNFRAERAYKRAFEIEPNWAAPHYNLALLYRSQQNDLALAELEQAAALDAMNARMLVALGDEYFAKQQWPCAADSYRKAIALKPDNDDLHTRLGHALYSQGLQAEANREYQKARELRSHQQ